MSKHVAQLKSLAGEAVAKVIPRPAAPWRPGTCAWVIRPHLNGLPAGGPLRRPSHADRNQNPGVRRIRDRGTIAAPVQKVGDAVARDENLADIETDKIVLELPAPQAGVLVELTVAVGDAVTSQQVIGKIGPPPAPPQLCKLLPPKSACRPTAIGFGAVAPRADGETLAMAAKETGR